ncbi:MAG: DUF2279 domain-containing protein [Cytophagales bacterium]|nr:DUF2279 domain-containing protein [Cytophagales bacterium]
MKKIVLLSVFLLFYSLTWAQEDTTNHVNQKRVNTILITGGVSYAATLVGLNELWYKNQEQSGFHFFNDNQEWQQIDKVGHFYTAYHISRFGVDAFLWAGMPRKKAYWYGGLAGFIFQTPIEILDGFSPTYGASYGDLIANTAGSAMVVGQYFAWDEIRIQPKFSFHRTEFAPMRPNVLGNTYLTELLKDYNGQTYWLSIDIYAFTKDYFKFPKWLNLAVGYGAEGMIYSSKENNQNIGLNPYRQYYLSLDIDTKRIKTRYKGLRVLLNIVDCVHLPLPTIEFSNQGTKFHPLYF